MTRRYTPNDEEAIRDYGIDPFTSIEEWRLPDRLRDSWRVSLADQPPYPTSETWRGTMQSEVSYKGLRIIAQGYTGAREKPDTMGFDVPAVFVVQDDFDEPALPVHNAWFWSPWDARCAIDFCEWVKTTIDLRTWPTTPEYEFSWMLGFRRNPHLVFEALHDIKKIIAEAKDFDENPSQAITKRLELLEACIHTNVR